MEVLLKVNNGHCYWRTYAVLMTLFAYTFKELPQYSFFGVFSDGTHHLIWKENGGEDDEWRILLNLQTNSMGFHESYIGLPHIGDRSPTLTRICPQSNSSTSSWYLQRRLTSTHRPLRPRQGWWTPQGEIWEWPQSPVLFEHNRILEGNRQPDSGQFFQPRTYNVFINELSEVEEAALLCQRVWVVSVLVHHAVGLQSSGTLQEDGGQLLQTVLCSEVEQRGKFLFALIWSQNKGFEYCLMHPRRRKSEVYSQVSMLCSSICLIPNSWKLDAGILDFSDSVSIWSRDSVTFDVKLKACQGRTVQLWKGEKKPPVWYRLPQCPNLTEEVHGVHGLFQIPTDFSHTGVVCDRSQADTRHVSVHGEWNNPSRHVCRR